MSKLDPYTLPRPKTGGETRTFTSDGPEYPVTLTLRIATFALAAAAEEEAGGLVETFLTGSDIRGPAPFPYPEIQPSQTLFRVATLLRHMQCPPDPADAYDTMELVLISDRLPNVWAEIMGWFAEKSRAVEDLLGKNSPSDPKGS